jgi:hypothetical protein
MKITIGRVVHLFPNGTDVHFAAMVTKVRDLDSSGIQCVDLVAFVDEEVEFRRMIPQRMPLAGQVWGWDWPFWTE